MPTILTHPAIPLALRAAAGGTAISRRLLMAAAFGSVLPDTDAIGFFAGVPYESTFGHRGFSHSLLFALLLALGAMAGAHWLEARRAWAFGAVFLATASHGVLDALTDGGLGVAFFSPLSNHRYFFPWRPIPVSPLGVAELLSPYGLHVLTSELVRIWIPCLLVAAAAWAVRRMRDGRPPGAG